MSLTPEPPLTRRAARELAARRAAESGDLSAQPAAESSADTGADSIDTSSGGVPATSTGEPPVTTMTTQILGPDGLPLTRRRLRELREQGVLTTGEAPALSGPVEVAPASVEPESAREADSTVEPESTAEPEPGPEAASESVPEPVDSAAEGEADAGVVAPEVMSTAPAAVVESPEVEIPAESREIRPQTDAPAPDAPSWTAPQGHWTRQLEEIDDSDSFETTFSREVGVSQATTSAIIISDIPAAMDLSGPLDSTGEILLTGSVALSPNLAATGAIQPLSDAADDRDRLDDQAAAELPADVPPVKAAAVASQHALGTPIVANANPRGNRMLTVLLASASVLAVLVTALVVTAIALNWI